MKRIRLVFSAALAVLVLAGAHAAEGSELFIIRQAGKLGYINKAGKVVVPPQFDRAEQFSEGLAVVRVGGRRGTCGYINSDGKFAINPQFDDARSFNAGLALVRMGKQYGFIDKSGKTVIKPQFNLAEPFSEGLALVRIGKKYGYISKDGKYAINPQFFLAASFSEGLAVVRVGRSYGYVDKTGKLAIRPQFDQADSFRSGLARVKIGGRGGKYGFVDKAGKYAINPQYTDAAQFSGGLAAVRRGKKYGYVDKDPVTGELLGHPRAAGAFARFIGHWARDMGLMDLMQALYKATAAPAIWLGLAAKGTGLVGEAALRGLSRPLLWALALDVTLLALVAVAARLVCRGWRFGGLRCLPVL